MLSALVLVSPVGRADDAGWTPRLVSPPGGYHSPSGEIRIDIGPGAPADVYARLSLELDNVDVSALVAHKATSLVYAPPRPLALGVHRLQLVENQANGNIVERGDWTFEVRESATFRRAELQSDVTGLAAQRIASDNLPDLPGPRQAQAGAQLNGLLANGTWAAKASSQFVYNSQKSQTARGRAFDLAQYLVTGDWHNDELNVGERAVGTDNLITQQFMRRGVSAGSSAKSGLWQVQAFSVRTDSITGFQHGLGVSDPQNRTSGGLAVAHPIGSDPNALTVAAEYLSGRGSQLGESEYGEPAPAQGNASDLLADSELFGQRLRLRGEYAQSEFDPDTSSTLFSTVDDHAYSLLAVFTPRSAPRLGGQALTWNVGVQKQRVGTFFRSLGNLGLPSDLRDEKAFSSLGWGQLSGQLTIGREWDNVDNLSVLPTVRTDRDQLSATYAAAGSGSAEHWRLFAQPQLHLDLENMRQTQQQTPVGYAGLPVDSRTRQAGVSASFTPGDWNWAFGDTFTRFDDLTGETPDTTNNALYVNSALPLFGQRLTLRPQLQHNRLYDRNNGIAQVSWQLGLGVDATLVPDRLAASVNLNVNENTASDNSIHNSMDTVDGTLTWTLRPPRPDRPGTALFFSGNYADTSDAVTPSASTHNYQLFVGLKIAWPAAM